MDAEQKISVFPFVLVLLLFLGSNVLDVLHYPQSDPTSGPLYRLHPVTYFLFAAWGLRCVRENRVILPGNRSVLGFGIVVLLAFLFSITVGQSKANFFILDTLFVPVLLVALLQDEEPEVKADLRYWLQVFFVVNCCLAIVERGLSRIIFVPTEEAWFESFRSYALLGHPLNNGLVTAFLTLYFVIISERTTRKFFFLALGLLAIFAFGARTALAAVLLAFPPLLLFDLKNYETEEAAGKFFNYLFLFLVLIGLVTVVLTATPFGERIFNSSKLDDDSADVRARVFHLFRHYTAGQLLWGIPEQSILTSMYLEKVDIIENFWIIWIFKYGIVITVLLGAALLLFLFSLSHRLDLRTRFVLLAVLLLVASGNNSLATNTTAIGIITLAALVGFGAYASPEPEIPGSAYEETIDHYPRIQPQE